MKTISNVNSQGFLLSRALGAESWVMELLAAWHADSSRLSHPRVSPMFSRLAGTVDEDRGDSAEMAAFRVAMARLEAEHPHEQGLVVQLVCHRRILSKEDEPAVLAGVKRLAQWVDAAMGEEA